ncbi:GNAT family N-acetyltransferase [Roseobacter sp.]|uniref:GNAT family N-acetyltransferase n=1 Tax=Roseobacter sp. TaxID=1907202 RepID=UPI00385E162F
MDRNSFEVLGHIRPAEAKDLTALLGMIAALAQHHGDVATVSLDTLARDVLGPRPWVRVLLAEHAGECIGYAALCPLAKIQFGQRGMDLQHLFVVPKARRMGVGQALVRASEAVAHRDGCTYLSVGTHPDNTEAHQIYPALGFEILGSPGPRFGITIAPNA